MPRLDALPADWPVHRDALHRIAAHVLGRARRTVDGMFDLVPSAGGFSTPTVGPARRRVRVSGDLLVVEEVDGETLRGSTATTRTRPIGGSTLAELCRFVGFEPDPAFRVGDDTPPFDPADEPFDLDPAAAIGLGQWLDVGRQAIDRLVGALDGADASVARLWPEHFDLGTDLRVGPDRRCNLGAAAGDSFHADPYFYVGPWDSMRPGDPTYWNAPFGAVIGHGEVAAADDPVATIVAFAREGLRRLADPTTTED